VAPRIDSEKAKQGRWGRPVLVVLVAGLILAMVAWFAAEWYGEAIDTVPDARQEQQNPPSG